MGLTGGTVKLFKRVSGSFTALIQALYFHLSTAEFVNMRGSESFRKTVNFFWLVDCNPC